MYAMMTMRANIAFAQSMMSQFISKVVPPHWMVVKHIRKGTLDSKLCLGGKNIALRGFCDANCAGNANKYVDPPWDTQFLSALKFFMDMQ